MISRREANAYGIGASADQDLFVLNAGEASATGNAAVIAAGTGLSTRSALCRDALDLFIRLYGAEAGNLALKLMATAGIYLGGGIAPKILDKLEEPTFMRAFCAKGRMAPLLEAIPVKVILNDRTALLGSAICAAAWARQPELGLSPSHQGPGSTLAGIRT